MDRNTAPNNTASACPKAIGQNERKTPMLTMRQGNTTFLIGLHYSKDSSDTFEDKAKKLIRKEVKDGDF